MGCVPVSDMDTPLTLLHVSAKCPAIYIYIYIGTWSIHGRDMTRPKKKRKENNSDLQDPHHLLKVKQHKISSFLIDLHDHLILSLSLSLSPFTSHALQLASLRSAIGLTTGDLSVVPPCLFGD